MSEHGPIPEPTEADLARDAAADLAVCEAATGGTWDGDANGITIAVDDDGKPTDKPSRWYKVFVIARPPLGLDPDECLHNVQLILLARTALPAWIKRAEKAEAEVARLCERIKAQGAEINHLKRECDLWEIRSRDAIAEFKKALEAVAAEPGSAHPPGE